MSITTHVCAGGWSRRDEKGGAFGLMQLPGTLNHGNWGHTLRALMTLSVAQARKRRWASGRVPHPARQLRDQVTRLRY